MIFDSADGAADAAPAQAEEKKEAAPAAAPAAAAAKDVNVPDIGSDEVEVTEILVKVGDKVEAEQSLIDLEAQEVKAGEKTYRFTIDAFRRHCMMNGLDSIGLTLQHDDAIAAYEAKQPAFMN